MIPGLDPIAINSIAFLALACAVGLTAWSGEARRFLWVLGGASAIMFASWIKPLDLAASVLFLVPPYLAARALWGKKDAGPGWLMPSLIIWQVGLFVVLRRYEPLDSWVEHPIAIIGLSYMLFRVLHLVVDAPAIGAKVTLTPLAYLTYVGAFWTLLAGPIQRYDAFLQGIGKPSQPEPHALLAAGHRAVNGLIKAFVIAPLFLQASRLDFLAAPDAGWTDAALVFYGYPAYLYLNFSGYSDLVIAVAALCGITLPENFRRPFLSRNVQEFWGRWHMSFGVWIRDYVFTPLCKELLTRSRGRHANPLTAVTLLVTFLLVGMWHGTSLSFAVFGLAHGIAIVLGAIWFKLLKDWLGKEGRKAFLAHPATMVVSTLLTVHFVCLTMQVFANPVAKVVQAWSGFLS